jgi:hypothetical protein
MATQLFSWRNDDVVAFSAQLQKVHRAALPNAVRFTLSDAAVNMKKESLIKSANKNFTIRNRSFFKSYSVFNKATGYDINKMVSNAGITKSSKAKNANSKSKAGIGLSKQEFGGSVESKAYIAPENKKTKSLNARTGKGLTKKIVVSETQSGRPVVYNGGKSRKNNLITKAYKAHKKGVPLLYAKGGKGMLYMVKSDNGEGAKRRFKLQKLANYDKGRSVPIKTKRPFIRDAAMMENKKLNGYFRKEAERQLKKFIR